MDIQPLSCKSRVSSGNLRVKQNEDGTYDLAQFTTEGRYAVGYYGYTANDLLNLAMSVKEYVNRTQLAKEGK